MSLIAHLLVHCLGPWLVRTFWRTVKRFPLVFAAITFAGQFLGAWLIITCWPAGNVAMTCLGVLCLTFYTGLLGFALLRWWNGTWAEFCDYVASISG